MVTSARARARIQRRVPHGHHSARTRPYGGVSLTAITARARGRKSHRRGSRGVAKQWRTCPLPPVACTLIERCKVRGGDGTSVQAVLGKFVLHVLQRACAYGGVSLVTTTVRVRAYGKCVTRDHYSARARACGGVSLMATTARVRARIRRCVTRGHHCARARAPIRRRVTHNYHSACM